ncbi:MULTISPECIES: hypothetical protein [Shewanella]|uniref:hypothetical protein n=1 Tax=Shewanella TaxID=22 RepID=UPI00163DE1EA|nr:MULTISPECIES: hypothetical protein [Shewanella]
MEFLLFCLIFFTAFLVAFKPHKQGMANICLFASIAMSVLIWLLGTWDMLVPAGNL